MNREFLNGFMESAGLKNTIEADEQWAGFSSQLPAGEREQVEAGGYASGVEEGKKFIQLYPAESSE